MRVYRLLIRLYPRSFRTRYRAELEAAFIDQRRESRYAGFAGAVRFWAHMVTDVFVAVTRLRFQSTPLRELPQPPSQPRRTEMDTVIQDVRYAIRQFTRRPGFAAVAMLSLALGIGANSLIYGLIDGFVLHPFAYPDPDRLVAIGVSFPKVSSETGYVEVLSPADYADIRAVKSFAATAAFDLGNRNLSGGDVPERLFTALLLDDLFPVIGMKPALGRGFTREELAPGGPKVAIISHRVWQSRFAGDPGILNKPIRIGGDTTTIVGVMPPKLILIGTDLWIPWGGDPTTLPRNVRQFSILARLAPGVPARRATAELALIASSVEQREKVAFKEYDGWRLVATPWAGALLKDIRPAAFLLLGAVALVLLIACANITNLFLARSTTRQRELAVRFALGAGRWRVARQLLTESLLLSLGGAIGGVLLARAGLQGARALIPRQFQFLDLQASVNVRVLLWSLGLCLASGILVAIAPVFQASRTDPQDALKADTRAGAGRSGSRLRSALVVAEIALSVVLLLGAGVLLRSFMNIQRVDPGFDARGVLTLRLTLPRERYPDAAANAFFDRLVERVGAIPGVRGVSASSQFPPQETFSTEFTVEGVVPPAGRIPTAFITVATPGYFEALRVPMRTGRTFAATDRLEGPPVAIVNQTFVDRYLSGGDAVGRRITIGDTTRTRPWTTIVGVVADYRNAGMTDGMRPGIFTPMRQQTAWNQLYILVRSDAGAAAVLAPVRDAVRALDPEQPIYAIQSLEESIAESSFQQRIAAMLLSIFAACALALAAVGIFGVMSYTVSARTQEIGVRIAVGAGRRDVLQLVLGHVARLAVVGLGLGVVILLLAGKALQGLLYDVRAADPLTMAIVAGGLGLVAGIAAWIPASRASRIDPVEALRYE
jgi:putative ABC transport system permease protein